MAPAFHVANGVVEASRDTRALPLKSPSLLLKGPLRRFDARFDSEWTLCFRTGGFATRQLLEGVERQLHPRRSGAHRIARYSRPRPSRWSQSLGTA